MRRTPRSTGRRWPAAASTRWRCSASGAETFPGALAFDSLLRTAESPAVKPAFDAILPDDARQVPADLGLHRPPQGGDQHPPHAVRQPADDGPGVALPRAREAGAGGLAALEPHLRRQPQPEPGAAQWRHAVHRRRAGRRRAGRQEVRNLREVQPTLWFNVPRGFEMLLPFLEADETWRATSSPACAWSSTPAPRCRRPPGSGWRRWRAACAADAPVWFTTSWGSTETSAGHHQRALEARRAGVIGLPLPGHGAEVHPQRREAGDARARRQTSSPATATRRT
jgi:feruloyl-CoA synthase